MLLLLLKMDPSDSKPDSKRIKVEPSDPEISVTAVSDSNRIKVEPSPPEMTSDEYSRYITAVIESQGFDVPENLVGRLPGGIKRMDLDFSEHRMLLLRLTKLALDEYNTNENTTFQFFDLEKATQQVVSGRMFYITFKAKDEDENVLNFRTKVWKKAGKQGKIEIEFCEKI